jgi:hypothetical protein
VHTKVLKSGPQKDEQKEQTWAEKRDQALDQAKEQASVNWKAHYSEPPTATQMERTTDGP